VVVKAVGALVEVVREAVARVEEGMEEEAMAEESREGEAMVGGAMEEGVGGVIEVVTVVVARTTLHRQQT
jgi:hypothetical protein